MAGLIYSANINGYDHPKAYAAHEKDVEYKMFLGDEIDDPLTMARRIKVMTPHKFPDYDWYLWLDGTMRIKAPVLPLIEKLLESQHDFAAFKHNEWRCAYAEIVACLERRKDEPLNLLKARALLEKQKLPKNFGQAATGVLFRKNTELVKAHALAWWLDLQATTMRDQATFMLNLFNQRTYLEWIPGLHTDNKWFDYRRGHIG